jgi:hypothetical protein
MKMRKHARLGPSVSHPQVHPSNLSQKQLAGRKATFIAVAAA